MDMNGALYEVVGCKNKGKEQETKESKEKNRNKEKELTLQWLKIRCKYFNAKFSFFNAIITAVGVGRVSVIVDATIGM